MELSHTFGTLSCLFVLCFVGTEAGSYCIYRTSHVFSPFSYKYCSFGCCGNYPDEHCCTNYVGIIIGGVVGFIVVVCIIVAIVCCCVKTNGHSGRVVRPQGQPASNVTVVYAAGAAQQYPGPAAYGMQPPQPPTYKQFDIPPPAYTDSDPAYPPRVMLPSAPAGTTPGASYPPAANPGSSNPPGPSSSPFGPPPPGFQIAPPTVTN